MTTPNPIEEQLVEDLRAAKWIHPYAQNPYQIPAGKLQMRAAAEIERLASLLASKDEELDGQRILLAMADRRGDNHYRQALATEARNVSLSSKLAAAQAVIDDARADLHSERVADWFPKGAHNAASHMSEAMRLIGNRLADVDLDAEVVSLSLENEGLRKALEELGTSDKGYHNTGSGGFANGYSEARIDIARGARNALAALSPPPAEGLEGEQGLSSSSREPSPSTCAATPASAAPNATGAEQ